jgi:peptide deformylase
MALRNIFTEGERILTKRCRPVKDYDKRLHILLDDMHETLIDSGGVGLAAPQVGVLKRVVLVMDLTKEGMTPDEQIIELINPEIIVSEGEQTGTEGCLSVPEVYGIVKRPYKVTVKAFDRNGEPFEVSGEGFTARTFCHELDHLEGHLFTEIAEHILTDEELEELAKRNEENAEETESDVKKEKIKE